MQIYEVIATFASGYNHVVIAKSKESAVKNVVNCLNEEHGFEMFNIDDFVANDPIDPNDYPEETVIN
ncbi:hypothetical protein ACIUDV_05985 [Limosilactobacillus reuteri]|uniref:hypothetical protein n=1 Tax=Limosilactobacillus reuteri TaxID=1598 RepID=UPI0038653D9E